jgi:hypothetical protein
MSAMKTTLIVLSFNESMGDEKTWYKKGTLRYYW